MAKIKLGGHPIRTGEVAGVVYQIRKDIPDAGFLEVDLDGRDLNLYLFCTHADFYRLMAELEIDEVISSGTDFWETDFWEIDSWGSPGTRFFWKKDGTWWLDHSGKEDPVAVLPPDLLLSIRNLPRG